MEKTLKLTLFFMLLPGLAYAYVDPGVVGMLLQGIFVVAFGFFFTIIVKPYNKIKAFFTKNKDKKNEQ